jgi:protease I
MLLGETGRSPMKLQGKKIIVLVEDLYQELEAWYPLLRMREEGAEVTIVGTEAGATYKSKGGYPITSDVASRDTDVNKYHGIIIPGGYAPDLVAAICHAGWMLTSADIVRGRKVTGFFAIRDDLVHAGAEYEDAEVVVDGTLITSRKPDDLPAFCREIIEALA